MKEDKIKQKEQEQKGLKEEESERVKQKREPIERDEAVNPTTDAIKTGKSDKDSKTEED